MTSMHRQQGVTLIVAMIMLLLMSLMAANAFKSSANDLRIVGNTQARQESIASAQKAIEETISSSTFASAPETVAATPVTVDIDGNGTADYTATLDPQPNCFRTRVIKSVELDPEDAADLSCFQSGSAQASGIEQEGGAVIAGNSLCATMEWNIGARVQDARTAADVTVHQGVSIRVLETEAEAQCL